MLDRLNTPDLEALELAFTANLNDAAKQLQEARNSPVVFQAIARTLNYIVEYEIKLAMIEEELKRRAKQKISESRL